MEGGNNLTALLGNSKKSQKCWVQLMKILGREGSNLRVSGISLKTIFQAVLLFGLETWVLTLCIERALGSIQYRVARRITGKNTRRREEGGWDCLPPVTAMEEAGFEKIGVYILKRQNSIAQYIVSQPIL